MEHKLKSAAQRQSGGSWVVWSATALGGDVVGARDNDLDEFKKAGLPIIFDGLV